MSLRAPARALEITDLVGSDPQLTLLRYQQLPLFAAVVQVHFTPENPVLPFSDFLELLEEDLAQLQIAGQNVSNKGSNYCREWIQAGWLIRRPTPTGDVLEPSASALVALRFLGQVDKPHATATTSRLAILRHQLVELAAQTSHESALRIATLEKTLAEVEKQLEAAHAGRFTTLDSKEAVEAAREIVELARDVPADFARVRQQVEEVNRELRRNLIDTDISAEQVLEDFFLGVDQINHSDAGRSFNTFYEMLMEPGAETAFLSAIEEIMERDFLNDMNPDEINYLAGFFRRLQTESATVRDVMTNLSRSLKQFVQSRQFEQFKAFLDILRRAITIGQEACHHSRNSRPQQITEIELTTSSLNSVGRLALFDPSDMEAAPVALAATTETVTLEQMREVFRLSQIDFVELADAVRDTLAKHGAPVSVGRVLEEHQATQGVGSVLGLMVLASRSMPINQITPGLQEDATETVCWPTDTGGIRQAKIALLEFWEKPDDY